MFLNKYNYNNNKKSTYKFKNSFLIYFFIKEMVKNCIYCSAEIDSTSVVDMCQKCMHSVWGEKMTQAILDNMQREKDAGNLELGRVSEEKI